MAAAIKCHSLSDDQGITGLRAALNVIELWRGTLDQTCRILHISQSIYASAKQQEPEWSVVLDCEQLQRISLVLNTHAALGTIFTNPDNIYGFPSMVNHNDFFAGRSPLEVMAEGDLASLTETCNRIDALR
ncbi:MULTISPECIES: hypothetical protein [unclassified Pseudomonas]|uniref:hypothetical protein n=1 Tax=unclassified Pseudomonas TaxID=196821 RepID=UPI00244A2EC8|nr:MULTISPECIES: hypothetical protein [unclassified Pseudomonas]MDH0896532.1 hypothetical protein [Pseudomonas sp. GD03875]MDH1066355.1 hypothetical protein [Pseudomonas sp. GD03985]